MSALYTSRASARRRTTRIRTHAQNMHWREHLPNDHLARKSTADEHILRDHKMMG